MATQPEMEVRNQRIHLPFLDGLRGFAALYVVFHHAWLETATCMPAGLHRALSFLAHGRFAVCVFIVLSGYVLMMPLAKSSEPKFRGGLREFFRRRIRRIVPPYWAALLISIAIIYAARALNLPQTANEHLGRGTLFSHVLLLHNISQEWYQSIDPPLWTVATEWQIYFVFALLLAPIWWRVGTVATTVIAFALGLSPFLLGKLHLPTFFWASPWFLGLFGFGMLAACAEWSDRPKDKQLRLPWQAISTITFLLYLAIFYLKPAWAAAHAWPMDTLVGLTAMGLIGQFAFLAHREAAPPPLMRMFQSKFAKRLGDFSYSLYLIHLPVMQLADRLLATHSSGVGLAAMIWMISIPLSIGAGWLLYLGVERHFKGNH